MAINVVVYPAVGANSFVSVIDADSYIEPLLNHEEWAILSEEDKARRLLYAYERFTLLKDFVPPADLVDSCLPEANARFALHSEVYSTDSLEPTQQVRKEEFGPMQTEYFKNMAIDRLDVDEFPAVVVNCLAQYGVKSPNNIGGVGAFRRTR